MIDTKTRLLGLIGYPLGHSLSPLLHNQAIEEINLNYVYLAFEVKPADLKKAVNAIRAFGIRGVNVTIPHKERVIPLLDEVEPLARKIGAVNTIVNDQGKLKGYNTDLSGLKRMLEEDASFVLKGKKAVIIGAEDAARAAGFTLCQAEIAEIYLLNRTIKKAEQLAGEWTEYYPEIRIKGGGLSPENYYRELKNSNLLIDTTPVGMSPNTDEFPVVEENALHSGLLVVDLVYNPRETALLKAARRAGAKTLGGIGMLIYQGLESFKLWTGKEAVVENWKKIL